MLNFFKNKRELFIRCDNCGYTAKVTKELFAKILGATTVFLGYKAWVGFLFAGTGFAMAICIAICFGGIGLLAYGKEVVEWLNKKYPCPQCQAKTWNTFEASDLELMKQKEQEESMKAFFGGDNTVVYFDEKIRSAFEAGIKNASTEIAIAVPFIKKYIISDTVIFQDTLKSLLIDALNRGVKVKILYGIRYNKDDNKDLLEARNTMTELYSELHPLYKNLYIQEGNVHTKVAIFDKKYMLVGSFNYLSFGGHYTQYTRKEATNAHYESKRICPYYQEYFTFG